MGRARGGTQQVGVAAGRFDAVLGQRRGGAIDPLLAASVTDAGRAAVAPMLDALAAGDYAPAMGLLRRHVDELNRAPVLDALRETVALHLAADGLAEVRPAARPLLAAAGAGSTVSLHVVRESRRLHILPNGLLDATENSLRYVTADAACGLRLQAAHPALAGDWANAPETYQPGGTWQDPQGQERRRCGPAVQCRGCAEHAAAYPDCEQDDDSVQRWGAGDRYDAHLQRIAEQNMRELLFEHLLGEGAASSSADLRAGARRRAADALETTLADWCRDGGVARVRAILGDAHAAYYAKELAKQKGIDREAADDQLAELVANRCWHGHLTWRDDDFEELAFSNPLRVHADLRKSVRYRVETCLGLNPQA